MNCWFFHLSFLLTIFYLTHPVVSLSFFSLHFCNLQLSVIFRFVLSLFVLYHWFSAWECFLLLLVSWYHWLRGIFGGLVSLVLCYVGLSVIFSYLWSPASCVQISLKYAIHVGLLFWVDEIFLPLFFSTSVIPFVKKVLNFTCFYPFSPSVWGLELGAQSGPQKSRI
jgi:hypothetical protein